MGKSYDPAMFFEAFEALVEVGAMFYELEFGTHEEDKSKTIDEETEKDARIFGNRVPRKKRSPRSHRSSSSRTMITPWTRVSIQQRSSEPQNPNAESEPSSSSCVTQSSKKRRLKEEEEEEEERRFFKKRKTVHTQTTPPEWLVNAMMREANEYNLKLIIKKQLYRTDLRSHQARLSIPSKQVVNPDFLTEEEARIIREQAMKIHKEGLSVDLVDPQMNKHVVNLRKWKMSGNWNYVFVDGWNNVVAANRFKVDDVFHIWCFRSRSGRLCFTLVPVQASHGGCSTSGESGHGNTLPDDDSGHFASTPGECSHGGSNLDDSAPV